MFLVRYSILDAYLVEVNDLRLFRPDAIFAVVRTLKRFGLWFDWECALCQSLTVKGSLSNLRLKIQDFLGER